MPHRPVGVHWGVHWASTGRPLTSTGKDTSQRAMAQNLNAIGTHVANWESQRKKQGQDSLALTRKGFPSNRRSWVVRRRTWASNVHSSSEASDFLPSPSRGKAPGSDVACSVGVEPFPKHVVQSLAMAAMRASW